MKAAEPEHIPHSIQSQNQTPHHWLIECNRTCGTPMYADAILIPAATPAASTATRPASSASFSATLASSMSTSAPEHSTPEPAKHHSAPTETTSNSAPHSG